MLPLMHNVQDVEELALVLMNPFDLHIEERVRVDGHPRALPDHLRQLCLVRPLDAAEFSLKSYLLCGRLKRLQGLKVGNPGVTDGVGEQLRQ